MTDWQPIDTAPKDGTVVLLRNQHMDRPIRGHWGLCGFSWRSSGFSVCWVSDFTPDKFTPDFGGHMVSPDEWAPAPLEAHHD